MKSKKPDPIPKIKTPMLATLIDEPFDDSNWLWETKWDGYRALCKIDQRGRLSLTSRNGLDMLERFPEMRDLRDAFSCAPILVDGEIVVFDEEGRTSFQLLQRSSKHVRETLTYVVFDCIYGNGRDLRKRPIEERKAVLKDSLRRSKRVRYSKHVIGKGVELYKKAEKKQLEGIVGKRRDSAYAEGRSRDWVKVKVQQSQECVIGGFTEPHGKREGFGSLLLGLYSFARNLKGDLLYVGRVGTGFDSEILESLYKQLKKREAKKPPFVNYEEVKAPTPVHWVRPRLVAQIHFTEWTADLKMRHPSFLGLRFDKDPKSCVFETAIKRP